MSGFLAPNTLAFMALANEYCQALETAESADTVEFTSTMTRLLPRIYISATDLTGAVALDEYSSEYIDNVLTIIQSASPLRIFSEQKTCILKSSRKT